LHTFSHPFHTFHITSQAPSLLFGYPVTTYAQQRRFRCSSSRLHLTSRTALRRPATGTGVSLHHGAFPYRQGPPSEVLSQLPKLGCCPSTADVLPHQPAAQGHLSSFLLPSGGRADGTTLRQLASASQLKVVFAFPPGYSTGLKPQATCCHQPMSPTPVNLPANVPGGTRCLN